jgi:hypothetical protein
MKNINSKLPSGYSKPIIILVVEYLKNSIYTRMYNLLHNKLHNNIMNVSITNLLP